MSQIKAIVHVISSARDSSGNCCHGARVTATETGRSVECITDGPRNPAGIIETLGLDWSEMYCIEESIPIRQWQRSAGRFSYPRPSERELYRSILGGKP